MQILKLIFSLPYRVLATTLAVLLLVVAIFATFIGAGLINIGVAAISLYRKVAE